MDILFILCAVIGMALTILLCRALPFILKIKQNNFIQFIENYIPPVAMTVLAVSALVTINWSYKPYGLPEAIAAIFIIIVHLWKRNALISILGGTALFMLLKAII